MPTYYVAEEPEPERIREFDIEFTDEDGDSETFTIVVKWEEGEEEPTLEDVVEKVLGAYEKLPSE